MRTDRPTVQYLGVANLWQTGIRPIIQLGCQRKFLRSSRRISSTRYCPRSLPIRNKHMERRRYVHICFGVVNYLRLVCSISILLYLDIQKLW
ncbi:hypothetical protein BT96DRAFT_386454 [Gymnopus androsaceus JB14]|uniref:Uncharacterized protein n=1 Tax=Gymnopus androsaceus JB14 TaxID=1447944 RepID=A0A6A4I372_9AGAR|nr:hypothetical protein BT96DRAFT_386454 [Gymnopus androsaceus JB14]